MAEFHMTDPIQGNDGAKPVVGIIMGSSSDWDIMKHAAAILEEFGIAHEMRVVSAHRMPLEMVEYGAHTSERGLRPILAGAGCAAPFPGLMAPLHPAPELVVPCPSTYLHR